jgi:hypothetical protein
MRPRPTEFNHHQGSIVGRRTGFIAYSDATYSLEKKFAVFGSKHDRLFIKNEK